MSDTSPRGRIVVVGGEKGGTSKTTTAVNFAAILADKGRDVLLVDTDPQASASDWVAFRDADHPDRKRVGAIQKTGPGLARELLDLSTRYEEIIVDAGGRDSPELRAAMLMADVFVSPFQASSFDIWTIRKLQDLYSNCSATRNPEAPELRVILVLARASTNPSVRETDEARELISAQNEKFPEFRLARHPIRERTVFRKAAATGLGVIEFTPWDEKADFEIRSLFKEVYGE